MNNLRGVIVHDADDLKDELTPQEREKILRRLGTKWIVRAYAGLGISMILTLGAAVLAGGALDSANGRLFLTIGAIFASPLIGGFLGAGLVERLQQPQRTQIRQAAAVARGNSEIGAENALLLDKNGQLVYRLVDAVDALQRDVGGRLDRIEQAIADLPDYGRGVIDGVQMRADALGSAE